MNQAPSTTSDAPSAASALTPLETLYDAGEGRRLPLPPDLASLYGPLRLREKCVIGNFVTTLDGVVSLGIPGQSGGGEISGFNQHDRMLMGLLRAVADAVVVGAGTLRSVPDHLWTAQYIYPPLAPSYEALRSALGKTEPPLNLIVTASGEIDFGMRVFGGEVPVLIVTTGQGAARVEQLARPRSVDVAPVQGAGPIGAKTILEAIGQVRRSETILVEGGPQLMGDFFSDGFLDELFLTLAPQVAGRDGPMKRPGLVEGKSFAPERPLWGRLAGVKQAESHLFLRYAFSE